MYAQINISTVMRKRVCCMSPGANVKKRKNKQKKLSNGRIGFAAIIIYRRFAQGPQQKQLRCEKKKKTTSHSVYCRIYMYVESGIITGVFSAINLVGCFSSRWATAMQGEDNRTIQTSDRGECGDRNDRNGEKIPSVVRNIQRSKRGQKGPN